MGKVFEFQIQKTFNGEATYVKGFDSLPGVLFLGLRSANNEFAIGVVA